MSARGALCRTLVVVSLIGQTACGGGGDASAPVAPAPVPTPTPSPPPPPPPTLPTITAQPSAQRAGAGTPVTFSVVSPNATTHQWQRSTDTGATWTDVAGANAASLTLTSPALIDNGTQYRVVVTNEVGSAQSAAAGLAVNARLRLLAGALGGAGHVDASGLDARFDLNRGLAMDAQGDLIIADSNNHVLRRMTPAGVVTTIAGTVGVNGRVDGPVATARLSTPRSVAIDSTGAVWFVDQGTCHLRKLADGIVSSVALLVPPSYSCYLPNGQGDPHGYDPAELAIGPDGDVFVSDRERDIISRVDAAGNVSLYAGDPTSSGFDDGPRLSARFRVPRGLAFDAAGNLYVGDGNGTIRRIDSAGNVTTIAGAPLQFDNVDGIGTDARLNRPLALQVVGDLLVITDSGASTLRVLDLNTLELRTLAGEPSVPGASDGRGSAARFNGPYGLAGNGSLLYVSDGGSGLVRTVTLDGQVTTVAGKLLPVGAVDGPGPVARFSGAVPLTADGEGNVYAADNHAIRKISPAGEVTTFAGKLGVADWTDGTGEAARFRNPAAITIDGAGNLIVADTGNQAIRKISRDGVVTTIAGGGPGSAGFVNGPGPVARFNNIQAVSVDPAGNIFVADYQNCSIRKISPDGMVSTPIGSGPINCVFIDSANFAVSLIYPSLVLAIGTDDVLFSDYRRSLLWRVGPDGRASFPPVGLNPGFVDGAGSEARFGRIAALARDANGNIYVADAANHALRLIRPDFSVTTLVHRGLTTVLGEDPSLRAPGGVAVLPGNALAISTEAAIVVD